MTLIPRIDTAVCVKRSPLRTYADRFTMHARVPCAQAADRTRKRFGSAIRGICEIRGRPPALRSLPNRPAPFRLAPSAGAGDDGNARMQEP